MGSKITTGGVFRAFILLFMLAGSMRNHAQTPIRLSQPGDGLLTGAAAAGAGIGFYCQQRLPVLTPAEVEGHKAADIPGFDRWSYTWNSRAARTGSDVLLYSTLVLPACLLLDKDIRHDAGPVLLVAGESLLTTVALTNIAKVSSHRSRPYVYNPAVPLYEKTKREARLSFFSGHTSTTAAMCFGAAGIWSAYHPDSRWKPLVWTGAALIPAFTGYLRIRGGRHFLSDVVVGYGVGATVGILIPKAH